VIEQNNQKKLLETKRNHRKWVKQPKQTKRNHQKPSKLSKKPKTTKRNHQKPTQGIFSFVFECRIGLSRQKGTIF